jgi:hypothetical protein
MALLALAKLAGRPVGTGIVALSAVGGATVDIDTLATTESLSSWALTAPLHTDLARGTDFSTNTTMGRICLLIDTGIPTDGLATWTDPFALAILARFIGTAYIVALATMCCVRLQRHTNGPTKRLACGTLTGSLHTDLARRTDFSTSATV